MKKILIIGATSAMARACARLWAKEGVTFFLVARDATKLQQTADDLSVLGASAVYTKTLDVNDLSAHKEMLDECFAKLEAVEVALIAHGTLPDQQVCQSKIDVALKEFSTNGTSTIALLSELGNRFENQHFGTIAVITSVAGDRGRPSNYLYGSAKAAVSAFCEGLRARLFKSGVHLVDIKPGFVDTPMTQGLSLPKLLLATPETIARYIDKSIKKKKDVVYAPWFWFWIMFLIKRVPQFVFKRKEL
jgi:decaprenylphospho-beta-D-erythro-pentofuranosid-2-ulose 2-reductase